MEERAKIDGEEAALRRLGDSPAWREARAVFLRTAVDLLDLSKLTEASTPEELSRLVFVRRGVADALVRFANRIDGLALDAAAEYEAAKVEEVAGPRYRVVG